MTQDEIIRMAREAGLVTEIRGKDWIDAGFPDDCLFDFAALVYREGVAHEREACASVCDRLGIESGSDHEAGGMFECAYAIRARGDK